MMIKAMGIGFTLVTLAACGSSQQSEPFTGTTPLLETAEERHGQVVFARNCNQCHPGGEGGLGPALNNKPPPAAAIKLVVRIGPAAMPAFSEAELSDTDVDAVAAYVVALRNTSDRVEDRAEDRRDAQEEERDD
jgi:mono/diheme cytochrome c family protein